MVPVLAFLFSSLPNWWLSAIAPNTAEWLVSPMRGEAHSGGAEASKTELLELG
jgi:hypothetical protein